jgi:alkanesulfonate monooxygenase SsuD/methylene tetrahydromethanopterin reductase-like flavin-dependent oxidoreductase (luciferase family)
VKIGVSLYQPGGPMTADMQIAQAKAADRQGFDSVWLGDHLMDSMAEAGPEGPLESFTLMTAIGAVTERVRLAWSMLNPSFRNPALLAKMLATLDQISHGRVICSIGAGWFEQEYTAYDIPFIADHGERLVHAREVVQLLKTLWTTPAPERVTFEGRYVRVRNLPFNPVPYQRPHPPIWIGGDSDATLANVTELADGWVVARAGLERVEEGMSTSDWPTRPMTVGKMIQILVGETPQEAEAEAEAYWAAIEGQPVGTLYPSFDDLREKSIVGTPEECVSQFAGLEGRGLNYVLTLFRDAEHQERVARLILPLLAEPALV